MLYRKSKSYIYLRCILINCISYCTNLFWIDITTSSNIFDTSINIRRNIWGDQLTLTIEFSIIIYKKRRRNKQKNIILLLLFLVTPCHASIWISDKITIDFIHLLNKRYNSFRMNTIHSNSYDLIRRFKTNRCSCFFNRFTMCSQFRILNVQG